MSIFIAFGLFSEVVLITPRINYLVGTDRTFLNVFALFDSEIC